MENTIILASPRSGSNFLSSSLTEASNLFHTYEFFSGGKNGNIYCTRHFEYIRLYHQKNYKTDYVLQLYKRMFEVLSNIDYIKTNERDAINPNHLALLQDFISHQHQEAWSNSLGKKIEKDRLLTTIFYNHYNYENHFDLSQAVEMVDNLIFLYRENVLKQFISYETAAKTGDWYLPINQTRHNSIEKITWNLEKYFNYYEDILKWTRDYKKTLLDFSHKNTAIIKYEDINEPTNYKQNISKVLESNGIDCIVGECRCKKQSIDSVDIADVFTNKEEFLDDYNKVKDKIILVLEDA
jgi:LPS sulfotransferase NodH